MKNDHKDNKFKELLDKLQQESWQLELLISGFAIFGLVSSLGHLDYLWNEAVALESYNKFLYPIAYSACVVLIVNLVIHVVLRGLWIGAIGLRYVSGEIDYESLKYKKRFTSHLKRKVGSFDKYINTLENYCSILFAITFLSLFYIISFFSISLIITFAGNFFIKSGIFPEVVGLVLLGFFAMFFLFSSLIVFIDFITQGYLKKKEWTSFLYFPIYKIFSIITLSFLYRPLVYNVLDDKFSKRLTKIITPIYIIAFFLGTFYNVRSNYISGKSYSNINYSYNNNYINSLKENEFIRDAALQSKVIKDNYLHIFIPFKDKIEELIFEHDLSLQPLEDQRGFKTNLFSKRTKFNSKKQDSLTSLYLKVFQKTHIIKIDNIDVKSEFIVTEVNNQLGFETIISLKRIVDGKHIVHINRFVPSKKTKKLKNEKIIDIPFWYFKQ